MAYASSTRVRAACARLDAHSDYGTFVNPRVSALLEVPDKARACLVLAHGAGAGMTHPFMADVARELAERGIATLRYQFPYMEQGSKRPDTPALAQATVRAAVAEAAHRLPALPLFAGGKSFGGRMTSQAQAVQPPKAPITPSMSSSAPGATMRRCAKNCWTR